MPATPRSIGRSDVTETVIEYGGETVTVGFDHSRVTLKWIGRTQAALDEGDAAVLSESVADLIHHWDVVEEDGSPFPPTAENISCLPSRFVGAIFQGIRDSSAPSRAEGEGSGTTSSSVSTSSTPPLGSLQNGPTPSSSPPSSAYPSLT